MKKFFKNLFACFIILVVFGAVLFFLGWTQFRVPSDGFGIIVSKTGGISSRPVVPGVFSWHWEFLIPSNAELKTFKNQNFSLTRRITGSLSSGDTYKSVDDSINNFDYRFVYKLSAAVKPEDVIKLLKSAVISDEESLSAYVEEKSDSLCRNISAVILKKSEKSTAFRPELLSTEELLELSNYNQENEYVAFSSVAVTEAIIPDFYLYEHARAVYLQNLEKQNGFKNTNIKKSLEPAEDYSDESQDFSDQQDETSSGYKGFFRRKRVEE